LVLIAFTRYEDKDDGSEYIYTLFVPMDAGLASPCFDQPDLKGRFKLTLHVPAEWTVISNTAGHALSRGTMSDASLSNWEFFFDETEPISTYLFAFAAGPFRKVGDMPPDSSLLNTHRFL
jgi:aminopeptidase N